MKAHCPKCGKFAYCNDSEEWIRERGMWLWKVCYRVTWSGFLCTSCGYNFEKTTEERLR